MLMTESSDDPIFLFIGYSRSFSFFTILFFGVDGLSFTFCFLSCFF